jgi:hypothetical protein
MTLNALHLSHCQQRLQICYVISKGTVTACQHSSAVDMRQIQLSGFTVQFAQRQHGDVRNQPFIQ